MPSEAKKTALPGVESCDGWCPPPLWADAAGVPTARAATAAGATRARAAAMTTGRRSLRFTAPSKAGWEPVPQGPCCARARLPGDGSNLHPRSGGVKAPLGYVPAAGGASSFRSRPAPTRAPAGYVVEVLVRPMTHVAWTSRLIGALGRDIVDGDPCRAP